MAFDTAKLPSRAPGLGLGAVLNKVHGKSCASQARSCTREARKSEIEKQQAQLQEQQAQLQQQMHEHYRSMNEWRNAMNTYIRHLYPEAPLLPDMPPLAPPFAVVSSHPSEDDDTAANSRPQDDVQSM